MLNASRPRWRKTVTHHGKVVLQTEEYRVRALYLFSLELPPAPLRDAEAFRGRPRVSVHVRPIDEIAEPTGSSVRLDGEPWSLGAPVEEPDMSFGPLSWVRSSVLDLAGREQPVRCAVTVATH